MQEEWVICRILHKTGEKRPSMLLQGQNHHHLNLIGGGSPPSAGGGGGFGLILPPLLESPAAAPIAAGHVESEYQNNNQGRGEESYGDLQIKSFINPVFSQYFFDSLIPPFISSGSTSSPPSNLPPFPTTNTNTANLWEDFMGFPFVTADGFQCF